jgi:glycosyltransferase involved in cell wall biosynthesis
MRVNYVLSKYPSSTEVFVLREIKALIQNGHTVDVTSLTPGPLSDDHFVDIGVNKIYSANSSLISLILNTISLAIRGKSVFNNAEHWRMVFYLIGKKQLLKTFGTGFIIDDLVRQYKNNGNLHFHSHHLFLTSYATYSIANKIQANYSLTLHTLSHLNPKSILKRILAKAVFLRTISTELKPHFNLYLGSPEKFHMVTNGVDEREFIINPIKKENEEIKLIAVGSLLDKKGFDVLIEACRLLKHYQIKFSCTIVGRGKEKKYLSNLVSLYHLKKYVYLIGAKENKEVMQMINNSDILISPSRNPKRSTRDGLPTVIIEAMSLEVPVIATDFAGIPDIVKDRQTGMLIPPGNYKALAGAVVTLIFNKDLVENIVKNAKEYVRDHYNLNKSITRLEHLFHQSSDRLN